MSNGDYREKIEEHRQSIELEDQQSSRMSRSRQKAKKKKKKNRKNPLLNILLFVLLGIPFVLLIYVSFFYTPTDTDVAEVEENGSIVEVQKNNTVSASGKKTDEPKIEQSENDSSTNNNVSTEDKEDAVAKQAEEEAKKAEQARLEEEKLAKQQEQQKAEQQQEEQKQKEEQAGGTTHTVQPNENLFRIALKYYNDASGVDKIMAANNLSSNSISVGQTLIIP
ncbi:LysM peptidoglycan-binding domain-containing protein [Ureibacillus aquaedulcis]|uniref:LysM peptidoglycan-binding domain-containing protein n=1 Tax=Ureibacillus aquaedulcis TaxID=3058421 RepID=A0ABT8GRL9_9BACL|nr:LysM peptidoglycan-binding domain-containing protein [Ureibacillus sp. BA0131]MDN4493889.1 LysM peptidoglycan-binding domain-containing protein [Ureibacillus sp. BA0131]